MIAAAQEESVLAARVIKSAHNLAQAVDAEGLGRPRAGGRIIEGGEGIDRHVVALLVAGSRQHTISLFRCGQAIRANPGR